MFTIHLANLKFFSFHGLYEEERILGNNYEVNVDVTFAEKELITTLDQTIDYVKVYNIIMQRMGIPTALLETVAQDLAQNIFDVDNRITSINISIKKINPPIAAFKGNLGVSFKKDF